MQIIVKSLSFGEHSLNVAPSTTIAGVKSLLNQKINVGSSQNLILNNRLLDDSKTLEHYNILEQGIIYQTVNLCGGGKKRKKKNYTTPKKIKHVKKKVKLPVLKFYKVDDDGKITRLRRECPSQDCGAGVFMAWHHDRQYCGRCGLTFVFNKEGEQA